MAQENINELEELQNLFFRTILQVPISTPKPAACWDTATLKMNHRIWVRKLNLFKYLQQMNNNSLAKMVFIEQQKMQYLSSY